MKIGTIYKNLWAGYETYVVDLGTTPRAKGDIRTLGLTLADGEWRLRECYYSKGSLKDREHYPIVGSVDIEKVLTKSILEAVKNGTEM